MIGEVDRGVGVGGQTPSDGVTTILRLVMGIT